MPGPQKFPHPRKPTTGNGKLFPVSDVKGAPFMWGKRIRVVCTDPDATESSSDEEEAAIRKRLVREIFVPVCRRNSKDDSHEMSVSKPVAGGELMRHKLAKKVSIPKDRKGTPHSRKMGIRQSKQGGWVAEIPEPCLGNLSRVNTTEADVISYDMASKKKIGPLTSKSSDLSNLVEAGDGFLKEQPPLSDLSSMCENDLDVIPANSKRDRWVNSASSVLQNGVLDDCSSLNVCLSGKATICEDFLSDLGSIEVSSSGESVTAHSSSYGPGIGTFQPFVKLHNVNDSVNVVPSLLLEEHDFQGDFGKFFEVGVPVTDEADGADLLDTAVGDAYCVGGEELSDIDFDLDTDALAWINGPEVCGVQNPPLMEASHDNAEAINPILC